MTHVRGGCGGGGILFQSLSLSVNVTLILILYYAFVGFPARYDLQTSLCTHIAFADDAPTANSRPWSETPKSREPLPVTRHLPTLLLVRVVVTATAREREDCQACENPAPSSVCPRPSGPKVRNLA